jgi:hypothetical protein
MNILSPVPLVPLVPAAPKSSITINRSFSVSQSSVATHDIVTVNAGCYAEVMIHIISATVSYLRINANELAVNPPTNIKYMFAAGDVIQIRNTGAALFRVTVVEYKNS